MAAWQHTYHLLPLSKLIEQYGDVTFPFHIGNLCDYDAIECLEDFDDLDTVDWWVGVPSPDKTEIEKILPKGSSWSSSMDLWGHVDKNEFTIFYDDERQRAAEVGIRLDLSTEPQQFCEIIHKIVELAARNEWGFYSPESGQVLPPDYQAIINDLRHSRAFAFCSNPIQYLEQLSKKADCNEP